MTDFRALCAELVEKLDELNCHYNVPSQSAMIERACAALADGPAVPEGKDLLNFARNQEPWKTWLHPSGCLESAHCEVADLLSAVLARWGNPAPQPVPVSERLQQMEDLAADAVAGLRYIEQCHGRLYGVGWDRVYKKADRLKPAHALPVPGQEVE